jgi:hypothetical protein
VRSLISRLLVAVVLGTAASARAQPPGAAPSIPGEVAEEPEGGAGVSPIELIPRVELRQAFTQIANGVSVHDTTAEIDIQFLRRVLLRYQIARRSLEMGNAQISGFGDVQLQAIGIVAYNATSLLGLVAGGVLNTASQPQLGEGRQQIFFGPGGAFKPARWILLYGVVQEQLSVDHSATRPNVNQLAGDFGGILFGRQYNWLKVDLLPMADFISGTTARLFDTVEVGSLVVGRVGLFVRAQTQLAGRQQLEYSLGGGVRYLFRLEKGKPKGDDGQPL